MSTNEESKNQELELLSSLTAKQQRFINLYVTGQYPVNKLAELLEVHPNTLFNWLKREDIKAIIADMQSSTHEMVANQLKALTLAATVKMHKLLDSPIDGVALQAAKDILDRAGHKSRQEIKIDKTVTTVEQKLKDLVERTIVDAEYTVEGD